MKPVLSVVLFVISICYVFGQDDDFCATSNGEYIDGACLPLNECPELMALIKMSALDREYLKQWHCGFTGETPNVCCPPKKIKETTRPPVTIGTSAAFTLLNSTTTTEQPKNGCVTRAGTFGSCVPIKSCPKLEQMVKRATRKDLEYVQRSKCIGPEIVNVCCEVDDITPIDSRFSKCPEVAVPPDPSTGCCGTDSSTGNKIIGGTPTAIDQYTWLALIEYGTKRPYFCGGSLISNQYVMTAAHCLVSGDKKPIGARSVRLGDYDITSDGPDCVEVEGNGTDCTKGEIRINISTTIIHPNYKAYKDQIVEANDIALIKLEKMAPYTEFIRPICLPSFDITKSPPSDLLFVVSGWGAINERQSTSNIKLHVELPFVNDKVCSKFYSRNGAPLIWDKQLCAGGEFNKDSCRGDSGGPLMTNFNEKYYVIDGIISFGVKQCGNMGQPSVYTKVFEYIDWIRSNAV